MISKIKDFLKKPFLTSIIILSGGSLLAQGINFACSMIMAREYSKDAIGYYTYILSIVTMFSTVINGRYDVPIVSSEDEKETWSLVKCSYYISIFVSTIVTVGAYLAYGMKNSNFGGDTFLLLFVFPMLVIYGLINILNGYNNRYAEYKLISSAYLIRTAFQNVFTIGLGIISPSAFNLLLSQTIGLTFGIKKQCKKLIPNLGKIKAVSIGEMKTTLKKYKAQPLVSVPSSFINALSYSSISLFVGNLFGMDLLAMYSISVRVLGIPLGIFSTNIAKIHLKDASDEIEQCGNFGKCTLKMIGFSTILSALMVLFLMLLAPVLFGLLYGESWAESGAYVQILAPMFGLRLIVGAVGFSFIIANKQKQELFYQILLFVGMAVLAMISSLCSWNIKQFLIAISICYSVIYLLELLQIIKCSKVVVNQI